MRRPAGRRQATLNDVRAYLGALERDALVDLILEMATQDDRLHRTLLARVARPSSGALDLAAYRTALTRAIAPRQFINYRAMRYYAQAVEGAIHPLEDLLREGHAHEVIHLAEHALAQVEEAIQSVDDSDGTMGDILGRLQQLHLDACKKAKPDPEELARRLFAWEMRTEWDTFYGAVERYSGVLGQKGLAVYRQLAEAKWAQVPNLRPGQDDPEKYGGRFRITRIMEGLARLSGDVEALVAVQRKDLSCPYEFLQIAETYRRSRKYELAMEWAEKSLKTFPNRPDPRLRELLAREYHRVERHDEAMALVWAEFADHPELATYRVLKSHSDPLGTWPVWREKALRCLREEIANENARGRKGPKGWFHPIDHSELVRVFLWEKDAESAWQEARQGGCSNDLWKELAAKREKSHPAGALEIYQKLIEPTLAGRNELAYREAVELLHKIRELMTRLDRGEEFGPYVRSIRAAHKLKRIFMKLLDKAGWS